MTFDQQADMYRLVATMARMDTPNDADTDLEDADAAATLYRLIEEAREIMKARNRRSRA